MAVRILTGDCRALMASLPAESVHCIVTSPPYFGLRDYGMDGQIGLEPTPDEFVAAMVEVFTAAWRVLRPDGTLWLNLGDSYAGGGNGGHQRSGPPGDRSTLEGDRDRKTPSFHGHKDRGIADRTGIVRKPPAGLKSKDLIGIPWRVAFALQAAGWYLRQDIVWAKPNPMPESVTDRCTKSHEYLFLLTKSDRYYFDATAIAEPVVGDPEAPRNSWDTKDYLVPGQRPQKRKTRSGNKERKQPNERGAPEGTGKNQAASIPWEGTTRNKRSVWTVPSMPFKEAHFATFPPALIEPCILAGTSEAGVCPACGAGWRREAEVSYENPGNRTTNGPRSVERRHEKPGFEVRLEKRVKTTGWKPSCCCPAADSIPAIILDPFDGAGTTGLVADRAGRDAILLELNPEYAAMAERRLHKDAGLFAEVTA